MKKPKALLYILSPTGQFERQKVASLSYAQELQTTLLDLGAALAADVFTLPARKFVKPKRNARLKP